MPKSIMALSGQPAKRNLWSFQVQAPPTCSARAALYLSSDLTRYLTCGQCYKTFYGRKLRIFVISQSLSLASLSSLVYCLWARPGSCPRVETSERFFIRVGFTSNIRLGWKGLPGANTLAYLKIIVSKIRNSHTRCGSSDFAERCDFNRNSPIFSNRQCWRQ